MRLTSPAATRNLAPIGEKLAGLLPATGTVLEVASGPGQHVLAFAERFPALRWVPSDTDPRALDSINAWRETVSHDRIAPALTIDLADGTWSQQLLHPVAAIVAINVCHIAPLAVTRGLLTGAAALLAPAAPLLVYGPFKRNGAHMVPSNAAFDKSLRAQDPSWGVRDETKINSIAQELGFAATVWHDMPSNNAMLELRKRTH
ncbi:MAG: SAM-dependent methyltransferase [Gammaproteobacteria bacterium]|nr:SAM-dependent methyltransferase [Gammaproteobacteria bacterium]